MENIPSDKKQRPLAADNGGDNQAARLSAGKVNCVRMSGVAPGCGEKPAGAAGGVRR